MIEYQTPDDAPAELEAHPVYRLCHAAMHELRQQAHALGHGAGETECILSKALARFVVDELGEQEGMDEAGHWGVWLYSRPIGDD